MKIRFEFTAQARYATGLDQADAEFALGTTVADALRSLTKTRLESLRSLVFSAEGALHSSLILLVNGRMVTAPNAHPLADADVITLLTPIGGG